LFRKSAWLTLVILTLVLNACSSSPNQTSQPPFVVTTNCAGISSTSLTHYDTISQQFLDEATQHPSDNSGGSVVWGTRYYMESLLDAYEATGNLKYIRAFMSTAAQVMNLEASLTVVNASDPSAPGSTVNSPVITVMGWPTQLGSFSESVAIPTSTGQTALYAQNLNPSNPDSPIFLNVKQGSDGGVELDWVRFGSPLESHSVKTVADLTALDSTPLIWGTTLTRTKATGLGLPAPGTYQVNTPINTIWHEQTGGIMLPFARFLWLAKSHPGIADPNIVAQWQSAVLSIATSYEDQFISDGNGGLRFLNPIWLPNAIAGVDASADYIAVEATMRLFLFEITGDQHQLSIARGLVTHQKNFHWQLGSQGWLLLKAWPCLITWSTRSAAPAGSVWDNFEYDVTSPLPLEDGATFVDLFHQANNLKLAASLGITPDFYAANAATLQQYLFAEPSQVLHRPAGLLRGAYPTIDSSSSTGLSDTQYPLTSAWYLPPELASNTFVNANWSWSLQFGQTPQTAPIGYFLRAWARSEAAEQRLCKQQ